jgi:deoxyribodipyrimidine photo-lyase
MTASRRINIIKILQESGLSYDASLIDQSIFPLTRDAALERLHAFLPHAGSDYARQRNFDCGPDGHPHVSRLSSALRRRLISEEEVVASVAGYHGADAVDKFITEIFWRTYWKGWLEQRPAIWTGYLQALDRERAQLDTDDALALRYADASAGRSGIDCFDAWVEELEGTGYLHNWARMQFASIWMFTLGLPWELGAAFTLDRLRDGDPASNTLSWRWVVGLHTAGKAYLADGDRIKAMTGGRFAPQKLARHAMVPANNSDMPPATPPRTYNRPDPSLSTLLLLTTEDLSLETVPELNGLSVVAIAFLPSETASDQTALADGLIRATRQWPDAAVLGPANAAAFSAAKGLGCGQVVTGFSPIGPTAARLECLRGQAADEGVLFAEHLRAWDRLIWPHCRKGFFALKDKIPVLIKTGDDRHG